MQVVKNKNIPLVLQLVKSDLTYEDNATVTYNIYDSGFNEEVSEQSVTWNSDLNSYTDTLSPSADWIEQETGNYLLVWNVSDTDLFVSTMTEEIVVVEDSDTEFSDVNNKLNRLLGLSHENVAIDQSVYDKWDNLQSARLRIYSDASSVGTDSNVLATYTMIADSFDEGKFNTWKQVKN